MVSPNLHFLANTSGVGALMQTCDWSTSPLGHPDTWPTSLTSVVGLILNARFPMFVAWGPALGFIYNDAYAEILGDKHPSALGQPFKQIWAEIWDAVGPVVSAALSGNSTFFENLPLLVHRKGYDEQTWFTFSYSPVHDEHGLVAGIYCACTETTEQVLAERSRVRENERLKTLFKQAPGYIAVVREPAHIFELANDAYYELVGPRELIGKPVRDALPEIVGQGFYELLDTVFESGEPFVGRALPIRLQREAASALDERFVDFVYQPIRDSHGTVTGIFIEGSDVTEAVHATQALRDSEARLRQLANTIPHLAWMADPDGHIHWYNDRWYAFTGSTPERMLGWGWQSVHDPDTLPQVIAGWNASLASGALWEMTFPLRAANGEYRIFSSRAAPLRDESGVIVQWFGTNTDVTEIEAAQSALKAAGERKDEFLAMLAHELRNPLAPISTAAELLNIAALDETRVKQTARIISRQVAHMTKLVDDLLDVSRVTRGLVTLRADVVDINEVVTEAVEQVHALVLAKQQQLEIHKAAAPAYVRGDRTRLIQVVSNLLNNAARYTPAGGHVSVAVGMSTDGIEILVKDDGIGLEPSLAPHIFDLFTQGERSPDRSQGGLGLGLALVKSLVELHAGTVAVQSQGAGHGSQFMVHLPRIAPGATQQRNQGGASQLEHTAGGLRVMVVDDNDDAAQMLAILLEAVGYQVSVAHDAHAALTMVQDAAPDVLLLDIGLPDMDGYALAARLRATPHTAKALLVAITGYGQPEDRARALAAGFDHHLVKPVKVTAVLALLDSLAS